jgi:DNA-binding beta-propeller fold protein YncE
VLVSQTTANVLEDEEESLPGVALRDLGLQRLKDFDRPVRVYQLDIEGLPREFPPLATRLASPLRRRRLLGGALAAGLVAGAVATAFLLAGGNETAPTIVPRSLVRIDPATNDVTDVVKIEDDPHIAVAAGGYIWIAHRVFRASNGAVRRALLSRVDMKTHAATVVGGGLAPCGLTPDPSGDVWVASCAGSANRLETTIVRVDAATLEFEEFVDAPATQRFAFRGLAYGGGSLWIGDPDEYSSEPQKVTRIDLETHERRSIRVGSRPAELAWAKRYLWVPNFYSSSVSRISGSTNKVETLGNIGGHRGPFSVAITDDAVWVAQIGEHRVWRIDPNAFRYDGAVVLPVRRKSGVWSLAAGQGSIWATTPGDSAVWRIDPTTNSATRIALKYRPTGVSAAGGAVWVAVDDAD